MGDRLFGAGEFPFIVRPVDAGELDTFVDCVDAGFGMQVHPRRKKRFLAGLIDAQAIAAFENKELIGTLASFRVEHTLPGPVLSDAAALSNVAVLPTHRRKGVLNALMAAFLTRSHDSGDVIALLHASEGGIYGRYGFGPATWSARYCIEHNTAVLTEQARRTVTGAVHLVSVDQARESFPLVFDAMRRARPGEVARLETWWEERFDDLDSSDHPPRFYACHEDQGTIDGYVIYEIMGGFVPGVERETHLLELSALSPAAYVALFSFLCGIDLSARVITLERPIDEPFRHCVTDPRALQTHSLRDRTWMRFIDVKRALGFRRYEGPGSMVFELHDRHCPWNEGRLCLEVARDGSAQVNETSRTADLECDVDSLAETFLGTTRFSDLVLFSHVIEQTEGSARRADTMFAVAPSAFCTADF